MNLQRFIDMFVHLFIRRIVMELVNHTFALLQKGWNLLFRKRTPATPAPAPQPETTAIEPPKPASAQLEGPDYTKFPDTNPGPWNRS